MKRFALFAILWLVTSHARAVDIGSIATGGEIGWATGSALIDNGDGGIILRNAADTATLTVDSTGAVTIPNTLTMGGNITKSGTLYVSSTAGGAQLRAAPSNSAVMVAETFEAGR